MSHTAAPHTIYQHITPSPLGPLRLAAQNNQLIGIWFVQHQQHAPDTQHWHDHPTHPVLLQAAQQLHQYFAGQRTHFDLPVQPASGTPFQRQVWQALSHIPHGHTCTYRDIAQHIGRPTATRAVGAAIGKNPHSIVVPCHRVLGSQHQLTGYAGGLDRKAALLQLERST